MNPVSPTIIIVGITGDLAEKKLLPALYGLVARDLLSDDTRIIGTSRRPLKNEDVLQKLQKPDDDPKLAWLSSHMTTITADPGAADGARTLAEYLDDDANMHLFYLSIPPTTYQNVITSMGEAGLNRERDYILVEKPFGRDGQSASELHVATDKYYNEANIFRVDHYLAKPGVRAVVESGGLVLNPRHILSIDVRSDEELDIQNRADFYEQTGALRDVVQSHLLQVLAVCMSAHALHTSGGNHHDLKAEALASLEVLQAYRAQYDGYTQEVENDSSIVETYAALELTSSDHNWRDVRITVRSGKALPTKQSDMTITFDDHSTRVFNMNANPANILDGYEQVLYDAASSDRSLFLSARDVDESWRIVDNTLISWAETDHGLDHYAKGTVPATNI